MLGKMLLCDLNKGEIVTDETLKNSMASAHPYGDWVKANKFKLPRLLNGELPSTPYSHQGKSKLKLMESLKVFGFTVSLDNESTSCLAPFLF